MQGVVEGLSLFGGEGADVEDLARAVGGGELPALDAAPVLAWPQRSLPRIGRRGPLIEAEGADAVGEAHQDRGLGVALVGTRAEEPDAGQVKAGRQDGRLQRRKRQLAGGLL